MSRPARRLAALALAALALGACGRKGPPVAPERRVPVPVADLAGLVRPDAIELTWSVPDRRADGTPLRDAAAATVFRTEDEGRGEPRSALLSRGRVAGWSEIATIRLDAPSPALQDGRLTYRDDQGLARGRRYTYVVLTTDSLRRTSLPSNRRSVTYIAAAAPPAAPGVDAGDRQVRLAWAAPARLIDGTPVPGPLAYEVLRATEPEGPLLPVSRTEPGVTTAVDTGVENDRTYHYALRAIRIDAGTVAVSAPGPRAAATPADTTAPTPPEGLVAVPAEDGVRLSWRPSPEPDVARYVVYRAAAGGPFVRVGSTRTTATTFTDPDVPAGAWRYAVTAVDASAGANESARSSEVPVVVD